LDGKPTIRSKDHPREAPGSRAAGLARGGGRSAHGGAGDRLRLGGKHM